MYVWKKFVHVCPTNFVRQTWSNFAQNVLIHWENWKLYFPHKKWVKTLVIFSKFKFQKNAQNLLIETQNNNYIPTPRKSQTNEKNILFQFLCLPLSLKKCVHIWFEISSVTSVEKRESRKHFSASACSFLGLGLWPWLQKTFPRFPFFYFGNFGKISNQTWTNFSSDVVSTKIETKYYFHFFLFFRRVYHV